MHPASIIGIKEAHKPAAAKFPLISFNNTRLLSCSRSRNFPWEIGPTAAVCQCSVWFLSGYTAQKVKRAHSLHRMSDGAWRPDTLCSAVAAQSSRCLKKSSCRHEELKQEKDHHHLLLLLLIIVVSPTNRGYLKRIITGKTTFRTCFYTWSTVRKLHDDPGLLR